MQMDELRPGVPLSVRSFDGASIAFDLYDAKSPALVLVVPGFWRDRRHPSMLRLAVQLNALGYRVAICDIRGHGNSEGEFGFNRVEHYDVAAVFEELQRTLNVQSISILALSYGAAVSISAVARHALSVASLLLISPVADFSMIVPRVNPFTIHRHIAFSQALRSPRFEWRLLKSPKLRAVDDIRDVRAPVSFIHVKNDWLIGHRHSQALYAAANEPKELHILEIGGNYHADRIFSVAAELVDPLVSSFLTRWSPLAAG